MEALPFGIDFGGSGIKGAPVDLASGDFAADRVKIKTPQPSTPEAVADVFVELLGRFPGSTGAVGVTVPAVVRHGFVNSAANIDPAWIGTDADALFTTATGRDVHVLNDADGVLVPNSELGHLEVDGHNAESRAANSAREKEGLSFAEWAERLTVYYRTVEMLFSPDLIVVGGGVSKDATEFLPLVDIETEIVPAKLQNRAGIVGAALWAAESGAGS